METAHKVDKLPSIVPAEGGQKADWRRHLPAAIAFTWLLAGWRDSLKHPHQSLAYGSLIFLLSVSVTGGLFLFGHDYILFPVIAGFLVVAPLSATGLYEKSRRLSEGAPVTFGNMIFVRVGSGGQIVFVGLLLCLLCLLWMRAAILLYALFFGLLPFPGLGEITQVLFGTTTGWTLLTVGTLVGGLFAAFSFAVSAFSIPMLLEEKTDALTAMGTSMALAWNNLPVMLVWGAIVLSLIAASVATAFSGLIFTFPVLGHATWHAYQAVRHKRNDAA